MPREDEDGPVLSKHSDHDPDLICRPALGNGLCEVLGTGSEGKSAFTVCMLCGSPLAPDGQTCSSLLQRPEPPKARRRGKA